MNNLHCKNPDNLKTDIDQVIGCRGEKDLFHSSTKVKEQARNQLKMPSKYATILTCSFEKEQKTGLDVKILSLKEFE